jgi:FtsP/CotA-like multicopper oxidase with cupredoxin domain
VEISWVFGSIADRWKEKITRRSMRRLAFPESLKGPLVWHYDILEHEDNEMVCPFEMVAAS